MLVISSVTLSYGQQYIQKAELFFGFGKASLNENFGDNQDNIAKLDSLINLIESNEKLKIQSITIDSYASPEGQRSLNIKLSERRSIAITNYLKERYGIADELITARNNGVAWDMLRYMVDTSQMAHKAAILKVLDMPEEVWKRVNPSDRYLTLVDGRNHRLMLVAGGRPYKYMQKHFFAQLRSGSILTIAYGSIEQPPQEEPQRAEAETVGATTQETQWQSGGGDVIIDSDLFTWEKEPLLAVKTNLLFDALLMPNIEVEVPIGKEWSIAAEWVFPWWVTADNGNALQLLGGTLEGRYWLGDRTDKAVMTGWFVGAHISGGYYDFQLNDNGYQGEYFGGGISAGFAHTINKSGTLRFEYALSAGFIYSDYRYYEGRDNNDYLLWQRNGDASWVGPTRAKVSLVWLWNTKKKVRRSWL